MTSTAVAYAHAVRVQAGGEKMAGASGFVRRATTRTAYGPMPPVIEDKSLRCPWFWKYQDRVRWLYKHTITEVSVAIFIGANFLTNIVEATIDPQKDKHQGVFQIFELIFNIAFTIELSVNLYAFWFAPFWKSGWNVFDFLVVTIGLLTTFKVPLPGPFTLLRMMRAFRVFRLFKRVPSLKKIMDSLAKAIPGVVNAFIIQILVMCIYAILAVEFWSTWGQGGTFLNERGVSIRLTTSRGQDYGYEYFGNFPKSMYTMFQVLTGDSWSEAVARFALHTNEMHISLGVALFYVTFVILNAVILINVVVAVLLEKMVDNGEEADSGAAAPPAPPAPGTPSTVATPSCSVADAETPSCVVAPMDLSTPASEAERSPDGAAEAGAEASAARGRGHPPSRSAKALHVEVTCIRQEVDDLKQQLAMVLTALTASTHNGCTTNGHSLKDKALPHAEEEKQEGVEPSVHAERTKAYLEVPDQNNDDANSCIS